MDWKSVAGKIIDSGLETLGGAMFGPLGEFIGDKVGDMIAAALGVEPTPAAIESKLDTMTPEQINATLSPVQAVAVAKWPAVAEMEKAWAADRTAQSRAINKTVQLELGKVSWWHWRHLLGYAVLAWVTCPLPIILYHMAAGNLTVLNGIVAALVSLIPLIGIAAALNGYVAGDTTRQKIAAETGAAPPTMTETLKSAITKAKPKGK